MVEKMTIWPPPPGCWLHPTTPGTPRARVETMGGQRVSSRTHQMWTRSNSREALASKFVSDGNYGRLWSDHCLPGTTEKS